MTNQIPATKVGLIGAGGIGGAHSSAYDQMTDARITAVVDVRGQEAEKIAAKYGARAYSSVAEMLQKEQLDMVDICTPTFTHKDIAIQCANHGLHVLCEKPIAFSLEDAQAMVDAARKNHVQFMVAQVIRFWPEYSYLKQVYDSKMYGKLVQAWFSRLSGAPMWAWEGWYVDPSRSGMAVYEMHIHDLDFLHFMIGKPAAVRSLAVNQPSIYASFIKTQYYYESLPGVIVEAEGGWWQGAVPFSHTFRVVFERATLIFDSDKLTIYEAGEAKPKVIEIASGVEMPGSINLKNTGGIYNEIAYFVECLRIDKKPTVITPEQSLDSLKILLAEIESAHKGVEVTIKAE